MEKNNKAQNSNQNSNSTSGNAEKSINTNTSNVVGPSRRYVSGDEEKSSSSHQFHKS